MSKPESGKRPSRDLLLEAAEEIMRDSGYAAVTSRKVAARAGLKLVATVLSCAQYLRQIQVICLD